MTDILCVHCGKVERDHPEPSFFEAPTDGIISMAPWKATTVPFIEMYEPDFSDWETRTWRQRMRRVFSDTVQWRLIALVTDVVVIWLIVGEAVVAGGVAILLFGLKTALFIGWRTWREAQLAD